MFSDSLRHLYDDRVEADAVFWILDNRMSLTPNAQKEASKRLRRITKARECFQEPAQEDVDALYRFVRIQKKLLSEKTS